MRFPAHMELQASGKCQQVRSSQTSPMRASSKPELSEGETRLHDIVALLIDLPEQGLKRGAVGTVVEVFEKTAQHPAGYIVEFVDEATGAAYAQADITNQAHLVALHFRREAA